MPDQRCPDGLLVRSADRCHPLELPSSMRKMSEGHCEESTTQCDEIVTRKRVEGIDFTFLLSYTAAGIRPMKDASSASAARIDTTLMRISEVPNSTALRGRTTYLPSRFPAGFTRSLRSPSTLSSMPVDTAQARAGLPVWRTTDLESFPRWARQLTRFARE